MWPRVTDTGLILRLGRSPGGGHGNTLQYSCLKNPMDRGAWQATVLRVAKSDMTESAQHTHMGRGKEGAEKTTKRPNLP